MTAVRAPAAVLARAFADDPVTRWVLPQRRRRHRALGALQSGSLRLCRLHGGVVTLSDHGRVTAAAGWVRYDHANPSLFDLARTGLLFAPWRLGPTATRRSQSHEDVCAHRVAVAVADLGQDPAATAYLWTIGVEPRLQGRGLGGRLLARTADEMRSLGMELCVLKTERRSSVQFYISRGFRVVDERPVHASATTCWVLAAPLGSTPELVDLVAEQQCRPTP